MLFNFRKDVGKMTYPNPEPSTCQNLNGLLKYERTIINCMPKNDRVFFVEQYGSIMRERYCTAHCPYHCTRKFPTELNSICWDGL